MPSSEDRRLILAADKQSSPLDKLLEAERKQILDSCQQSLDGRQAMLLILIYENDQSFSEAAEAIGVCKSRAIQIHQRVLRVLEKQLRKRGVTSLRQLL